MDVLGCFARSNLRLNTHHVMLAMIEWLIDVLIYRMIYFSCTKLLFDLHSITQYYWHEMFVLHGFNELYGNNCSSTRTHTHTQTHTHWIVICTLYVKRVQCHVYKDKNLWGLRACSYFRTSYGACNNGMTIVQFTVLIKLMHG